MSVNKHRPHVLVLPEDDACRQLAIGFVRAIDSPRQMHVEQVARGWRNGLHVFQSDHVDAMDRYPDRFMILLIDFDGQGSRRDEAQAVIPAHLSHRVFILGVWTEPEDLRSGTLNDYETIGFAMARDCRNKPKRSGGTNS